MTPRRLDRRAVEPKLRKIDELLGRLHQLGEFDEKRLQTDHVDALAVERILTLVVDLAFAINSHAAAAPLGRAPDTYAESFTLAAEIGLITTELGAALAPSAGTRNVLVPRLPGDRLCASRRRNPARAAGLRRVRPAGCTVDARTRRA